MKRPNTKQVIKDNPCAYRFPASYRGSGSIYRYGCKLKGTKFLKARFAYSERPQIWVLRRCPKCKWKSTAIQSTLTERWT